MDLTRLREINEQNAQIKAQEIQGTKSELSNLQLQETIVRVAKSVIEFMEGNVSRTYVVNQLKDFTTREDAANLIKGIDQLHNTLKTHENTDLTEITEVMKSSLAQLEAIPKEPPAPQEQKFVDYTKQINNLTDAVKAVNKAIKEQKTVVEAPVVNVEAPQVTVDAPDLKPLTKEVNEAFAKAIQSIVFPDYSVDLTEVEKKLDVSNKLLKEIRDTPSGGGSGGGGSIAPFLVDGALPITGSITASSSTLADFSVNDIEEDTTSYFGYTKPDGTWLIKSLTNTSVGYATESNNGSVTSYTDAWTGRAGLTYGRFDEAF